MTDAKVIVVEPSDARALSLVTALRFLDLEPKHVHDLAEVREYQRSSAHDWLAVIVGEDTIATQGAELVAQLRSIAQPLPVIYVSNDGLPRIAETSGDLAWLHLGLPIKQRRLSAVMDQAQNVRTGHPTQPGAHRFRPSGNSRAMRAVHRLIEQVAPIDTSVLILGESGTGKELVARHIHELSSRAGHPFVPVNCGAIPADLLEAELFGYEKDAFNGALTSRLGHLEFAEGGTLFLDSIGEMSLPMQVQLLRVLQERSFERVGGNLTMGCNVRIIAASHRDLDEAVAAGRFREDLLYRLNAFPVPMPPLRERLEDLPLLIEHLTQRQGQISGRHIRLAEDAMDSLARNRWPGNVRELSNLLERLAILFPVHTITAEDLPLRYRHAATAWPGSNVHIVPPPTAIALHASREPAPAAVAEQSYREPALPAAIALQAPPDAGTAAGGLAPAAEAFDALAGHLAANLARGGFDLKDHLSAIEIDLIRKALDEADGTVAGAARLLNIRRTTLVEKLRKYRLSA